MIDVTDLIRNFLQKENRYPNVVELVFAMKRQGESEPFELLRELVKLGKIRVEQGYVLVDKTPANERVQS